MLFDYDLVLAIMSAKQATVILSNDKTITSTDDMSFATAQHAAQYTTIGEAYDANEANFST